MFDRGIILKTRIVEATNGFNWGKFMVMQFEDDEWTAHSAITTDVGPLLPRLGWTKGHVWVLDLQTGEGALFRHGGSAIQDLNKHKIWVCPLFEPFSHLVLHPGSEHRSASCFGAFTWS